MGQKANPTGLRVGVIKDWESHWYAENSKFAENLIEDYKLRKFLLDTLKPAGVPKVEIDRDAKRVRINIYCAKPGIVIGRGGSEIDKLKAEVEKMLGKQVSLNIVEIKQPDLDSQLVAENIAAQLERRVSYRRATKQAIGRTMRLGAKGIKIQVSGRLGGAEIARSESYHEGTIPLQTIRADIDYGFAEAATTYGRVGVKVWIYKGEVLHDTKKTGNKKKGGDK
ncbi:MAG: 30S ribosomal protein S3 [Clostridia bacterium]|nr:30S ribosomal protein S3 [Clostridia bacterium]